MKLFVVMMVAAVALSGCESPTDGQRAMNMCDSIKSNSAWGECYARARDQMDRDREVSARRSQETSDAAGLLLLGVASFANGYTSARSHRMTCTNLAGIITCD